MTNFPVIFEQIVNGLVLGSMYALVASGLTLIWGTMKMLNFAHGELYMLGGFGLYFAVSLLHLPPWTSVPLVLAAVFILAVLLEKGLISPLLGRPDWDVSAVVATLGIGIFIQNFAFKFWGGDFQEVPYMIPGTVTSLGVTLAWHRLYILGLALAVLIAFWQGMKKTRFGLALRATAQESEAATLMGIPYRKIYTLTFSISASLAALAGTALAPIFSVNPWMGSGPLIKAFIVVILGGLGSFVGAILGGFIIGISESLSVLFLGSGWKDLICFLLLILVLVFKPAGLLGGKEW
ncbi:MAG: branched-chain amino acid transporter permease [Deltaproteobacteria bacterium]|jgi:branched-chain amino acid transport system permease protein|nr:branched-chain amino acid transporter permease [Deltaproteobacteria bacterium]